MRPRDREEYLTEEVERLEKKIEGQKRHIELLEQINKETWMKYKENSKALHEYEALMKSMWD